MSGKADDLHHQPSHFSDSFRLYRGTPLIIDTDPALFRCLVIFSYNILLFPVQLICVKPEEPSSYLTVIFTLLYLPFCAIT